MIKGIAASAGVATAKAYKLEQPVVVVYVTIFVESCILQTK